MSVSYNGSEVTLDEALDDVFTTLQQNINDCHVYVRSLAMFADRNDEYEIGLKTVLSIHDEIDSMMNLFKELKSVTKQVLGNPPASEKAAMKKITDDHAAAKKRLKDDKKAEEALVKSMAASTM